MKRHRTDLFALLVGLAFAIAGTGVIISQAADSGVSGRAVAAAGLILLGVVALAVTLLRSRDEGAHEAVMAPAAEPAAETPVSLEDAAEEPAG